MVLALSASLLNIGDISVNAPKTALQLEPDEWDFRGLNSEHLHVALKYERERENNQLQKVLGLLTTERRNEIEDLVEADWDLNKENHKLPWYEREGSWLPTADVWSFLPILFCCWYCKEFPKPWMTLTEAQWGTAAERCGKGWPPLRILTRNDLDRIERLEKGMYEALKRQPPAENERNTRRYIIEIDWERGDDPELKPLLSGLLDLRPPGVRPRKRHTGKKAAPQTHRLRWLAAWRLAKKAHLSFKDASRLVEQRKRTCPRDNTLDLLPSYASAGAWTDAVNEGARLVGRC